MASEEEIKARSKAVENQWSPDKYEDKTSCKHHDHLMTTSTRTVCMLIIVELTASLISAQP